MTIFHSIIKGEIPCAKVYEDERIFCFMDAFPQTRGHALIVAKNGGENLLSTSPEDLAEIIKFSQKLAKAQKEVLGCEGIKVCQFNGKAAGQTVFFYHMHLIPCYENKAEKAHASKAADKEELQEIAQKLAEYLKND